MANDPTQRSDKELALWMLERMQRSEESLAVIKAARRDGTRDLLDTPEYVARHRQRLAPLYKGGDEETVELPPELVAALQAIGDRDLLSGNEELIEKALAAYIKQHPKGDDDLPTEWETTFDLARAEVEGRISGAFKPGFTAELAAAARREIAREAGADRSLGSGRED